MRGVGKRCFGRLPTRKEEESEWVDFERGGETPAPVACLRHKVSFNPLYQGRRARINILILDSEYVRPEDTRKWMVCNVAAGQQASTRGQGLPTFRDLFM